MDVLALESEQLPSRLTHSRLANRPIGENNIVASFRFEDGSIGNLLLHVGSKTRAASTSKPSRRLGVGRRFQTLSVRTGINRTRTSWRTEKGYAAQLEDFISAIREGKVPEVTVRDGARATSAACG